MNQPKQSPPTVKEEQQEKEEDTAQSNGAGISANQCSSSNFENSNTIGTAAVGNGSDDINGLKLKMAALEAKNQILEGKLANQEMRARMHAMSEEGILANLMQENTALWMKLKELEENAQKNDKKMIDEFEKRWTALETKHQQEIAGLKAIVEKNQQPIAKMPDCVVVNMQESQGTSNNSNGIHHRNRIVANSKQTSLATAAALIPPQPKSVAPIPVPCQSAEQEEAKRLCNPLGNRWNPHNCKATMKISLPDLLSVHNSSPVEWGNLIARKGFPVSASRQLKQIHFAGPILYYYEITAKSPLLFNEGRLSIGFTNGSIKKGSWIGRTPNTYAMQDDKWDYCLLAGDARFFEWPAGAIKPTLHGCGDVFGCGLVVSHDNKLAMFFTTNGTLMGKQSPIVHPGSILHPCLQLNRNITVEANFGQKPFKYNIDQCPGLRLQW